VAELTQPVTEVPKREYATAPFFFGVLLLLCSLTFYYFAVLKIDYKKTLLFDLDPTPDAVEYFAQAKAMFTDRWPSIRIGYDELPSRYPFGYPALMLPWLKILAEKDAILAPFRTNQTLGLLLILAGFGFYTYLAMPLRGGFAALLLATMPGFVTFCRSSMSEISVSALVAFAFMLTYLGLKEERRWKIYLSAIFLGLSVNVRIQSVFFAPLLLAIAVFPAARIRLGWFLHCIAAVIIFALAASPMLVMNAIQFHSPFKTGYDFWVPFFAENHLLFLPFYIPHNVAVLWREFTLQPNDFFAANNFGTGTMFVAAFILLIGAGFLFIQLNRFAACAFLSASSFLFATLSYRFGTDKRFYLPLLIVLIAVAVLPVSWATKNLFVRERRVAALAIFVLFAAACLGYPSRSGYDSIAINRSQAWDAVHFTNLQGEPARYIAQRHFAELFGDQPGIVLSDINPAYLNALLPYSFAAAPIDEEHDFKWSKIWRYGPREALALVRRGLDRSLPVYALFTSMKEMTTAQPRLPAVPEYQWTIFNTSGGEAVVFRLTPVRSSSHVECNVSPVEH
jgi:hypothetical protein